MKKKKLVTGEELKKEYPRCCLMDNPLNVKTYKKMLKNYKQDVLEKRLWLCEMLLQREDFLSIEVTVKSIDFYLSLYADGKL